MPQPLFDCRHVRETRFPSASMRLETVPVDANSARLPAQLTEVAVATCHDNRRIPVILMQDRLPIGTDPWVKHREPNSHCLGGKNIFRICIHRTLSGEDRTRERPVRKRFFQYI